LEVPVHGPSQGYIVSAGIMAPALVITLAVIRVKREDLAGVNPIALRSTDRLGAALAAGSRSIA
jgi:hypothetical protein